MASNEQNWDRALIVTAIIKLIRKDSSNPFSDTKEGICSRGQCSYNGEQCMLNIRIYTITYHYITLKVPICV